MSHETDKIRLILPSPKRVMKLISNSLTFDSSDAGRFRLHVLTHYYKFGWRSAVDAFGVKKSTLYDWKRLYEEADKKLVSLIPRSTRPHTTRVQLLDFRLVEFIRSLREDYGNLGKAKIKPFLDEYARKKGLTSYGTTKIGVIVRRKNFFFEGQKKYKKRVKLLTPRVKRSPKEIVPGYIEMDSVIVWHLGKKLIFTTAIDVVTRFAWVRLARSLSSKEALLGFREFQAKYPCHVRAVQTDNGSEFLKDFTTYLDQIQIRHEFIYPRSPKVNGYIERFNRTVQEEFIQRSDHLYYDIPKFTQKLTDYLIWYNTLRPHYSLGQISPQAYMEKLK